MGQRLTYWIFLGVMGFAAFFLLHASIAFNANAPIDQSKSAVEGKTAQLATQLGFTTDSLQMVATRTQHLNYYDVLRDSAGSDLPPAAVLNERDVNLTGWLVQMGTRQSPGARVVYDKNSFLSELGILDIRYDQEGKVRRISAYAQNPNPTFVAGDSLFAIANRIVGDIFDYDLGQYILNSVDVQDTLKGSTEPGFEKQSLNMSNSSVGNNMVFHWKKKNFDSPGPQEISLEVEPMIKENNASNMARIQYGVAIEEFRALDKYEPEQLDSVQSISKLDLVTTFVSLGLLAFLIFFLGIKYINKGQVEWRRAIIVLVSIMAAVLLWRTLYLLSTIDVFLSITSKAVFVLNNLLYAAVMGLYAAMAYIGWEVIARSRDQEQLNLVDAFWQNQFFFRENGEGLLRGYAVAGVMLGIFSVGLYAFDTQYYQADSQFGFAEASMQPKLLTINISIWINAVLVALGHVGVVTGFLSSKINNRWLYYGVGTLTLGLLFTGVAKLFGIFGPGWYDLVIFSVIGAVVLYVMEKSGLLSFATGWWVFMAIVMIMPYWGSSSMDVAYISWAQFIILGLPLLYGFIAFKYGSSVHELSGYIPAYQQRMADHLRVEKEIEIARESQFKLMPLKPPSIEGVDVYGFFMPSFEVGGDYFDYIVGHNGSENSKVLNMTIVDVSGKAMKAAMHAVFTSGLLLSRLHRDAPESILREITPTLYSRTDPQTFITCLIAQFHLCSKMLTLANAGHCLPILKRDGKAEFLSTPDPKYPLGVQEAVDYKTQEIQMHEGDFLLLYSDGLPEAVNPEGERFGFDNLVSLVESLDTESRPSNEISMDIKRRVQKFSDYQLADDTTIICLKV
ncbi:SpoIIE family protein phosphatase [Fodinibius halophilus]|uniref:SpoIIE family protein phosphatase n=1 Tax=Fodinibius halophilus TaxID=1736908 RepID=A0A6M1SYF1_9BACT|nr:SpoIIE family protein phosphatase [Fodinibius halophilus]NGP88396.1 SpoIIE family protein phosphatase [Fodinibius halophilus]